MAKPPLPDTPMVRVRLIYTDLSTQKSGSRFYIGYSGSAPTGANCATLASDIASLWNTNYAPQIPSATALTEIDVLDIATDTGLSGQWTGSHAGTRSGQSLPTQVTLNIEYGVARRYRGGKPRIYMPGGVETDLNTNAAWLQTYADACATAWAAVMTGIEALTIGSMGTLTHLNLRQYSGYTNISNPGERAYAKPNYIEPNALHDVVTGYFGKALCGSQRRRRTSTTP